MLVGLNEVVRPVATGDTVALSATLPVKPRLLSVIVDVAELPATKLAGLAADAVIVKSAVTVTVTVAVWDSAPLDPVTVTVYVPEGVAAVVPIVRVEVTDVPSVRMILVGANVKVMPVAAGDTVADGATLPVNPRLLAVMVDVADPPATKLAGVATVAAIV